MYTIQLFITVVILCTVYARRAPDFAALLTGPPTNLTQSPINIVTQFAINENLPRLTAIGFREFYDADFRITNTGHTVRVELANKSVTPYFLVGGPILNTKKYVFREFHFHWDRDFTGSEHAINGERYPLEIHFVHYNEHYGSYQNAHRFKDGICVLTYFGQLTEKRTGISKFMKTIHFIRGLYSSIIRNYRYEFLPWLKKINIRSNYYVYNGSLTSPPFTECVFWIISSEKIKIQSRQLNKFRKLYANLDGGLITDNGRKLQPLQGRKIIKAVLH